MNDPQPSPAAAGEPWPQGRPGPLAAASARLRQHLPYPLDQRPGPRSWMPPLPSQPMSQPTASPAPTAQSATAAPPWTPAGAEGATAARPTAGPAAGGDPVLCGHCGRTASNGISCQGICVADSGY